MQAAGFNERVVNNPVPVVRASGRELSKLPINKKKEDVWSFTWHEHIRQKERVKQKCLGCAHLPFLFIALCFYFIQCMDL